MHGNFSINAKGKLITYHLHRTITENLLSIQYGFVQRSTGDLLDCFNKFCCDLLKNGFRFSFRILI